MCLDNMWQWDRNRTYQKPKESEIHSWVETTSRNSGKGKKLALVSKKRALDQVWVANGERTIYSWDFRVLWLKILRVG